MNCRRMLPLSLKSFFTDLVRRCRRVRTAVVQDAETHSIYANIYCARCNNVTIQTSCESMNVIYDSAVSTTSTTAVPESVSESEIESETTSSTTSTSTTTMTTTTDEDDAEEVTGENCMMC